MSENNFLKTIQECPWTGRPLDIRKKGLRELKFNKIYDFLKGKKGRLLEIGCGHGKMLSSLYHVYKAIEYSGCDISNEAIEFCKRNFPFGNFFIQDAENIGLSKEYDFVLIADVLEHVDNYRKVLENAYSALKEGGHCIIIVVTEGDCNIYRLLRLIKKDWSEKTRGHINYYKKNDICKEIERYFIICKKEYMYHFFGSLFDAVIFFMTLNTIVQRFFLKTEEGAVKKYNASKKIISFFESIACRESEMLKDIPIFSSSQFIAGRKG